VYIRRNVFTLIAPPLLVELKPFRFHRRNIE
jgi:hypothetical protein